MKTIFFAFPSLVCFALIMLSSCGGNKTAEVTIPPTGKKLMAHTWKYDVNANLKKGGDDLKENTGVTADIELKGDVGKLANFTAESITFGQDKKDKSKLSYKQSIGEGVLSSSVLGYWEISEDSKTLTMREWDKKAGKEKEPVTWTIEEVSDEKLVLVNKTRRKNYKKK